VTVIWTDIVVWLLSHREWLQWLQEERGWTISQVGCWLVSRPDTNKCRRWSKNGFHRYKSISSEVKRKRLVFCSCCRCSCCRSGAALTHVGPHVLCSWIQALLVPVSVGDAACRHQGHVVIGQVWSWGRCGSDAQWRWDAQAAQIILW